MDALALVSALCGRGTPTRGRARTRTHAVRAVHPRAPCSSSFGRAASEAVAGTRPRGADEGEDAALAYEMLLSPKEHEEFSIVREEAIAAGWLRWRKTARAPSC